MMSTIPDKQYFRIGEVSRITGLKPYVLRYWETEFDVIEPKKSRSNQRIYDREDAEIILLIKELLYNQKFTIAGARKCLAELKGQKGGKGSAKQIAFNFRKNPDHRAKLKGIKQELNEILELLK